MRVFVLLHEEEAPLIRGVFNTREFAEADRDVIAFGDVGPSVVHDHRCCVIEEWEVPEPERATLDNSGDERRTETGVSTTGTIR